MRKVYYKGREAALRAFDTLAPSDKCCAICYQEKAEFLALNAEPMPTSVKALFVVPKCPSDVPHLFHRTCLKDWLKTEANNKCPLCVARVVRDDTPTHSAPASQVSSLEA